MEQDEIPVLVYEGDYSAALVVKSALEGEGIEVNFDDLPVGGASGLGRLRSRIYVARHDEAVARQLIAAFEGALGDDGE